MRIYPEDYKGPKAGISFTEEWVKVTEFEAFKYVRFETWNYSDFDCWLGAMKDWHYNKGGDDVKKAFEEMQKVLKIR